MRTFILVVHKFWAIQYPFREIVCVLVEISAVVMWLMKKVSLKGNKDKMLHVTSVDET